MHSLVTDHNALLLDVKTLTTDESKRDTDLGHEIEKYVRRGKSVPIKLVTLLLRKILYSGEQKTFVIENLADEVDAVREFEKSCIQMTSVLYPTS